MLKIVIEAAGVLIGLAGVAMFSLPIAMILSGVLIVVAVERN